MVPVPKDKGNFGLVDKLPKFELSILWSQNAI